MVAGPKLQAIQADDENRGSSASDPEKGSEVVNIGLVLLRNA